MCGIVGLVRKGGQVHREEITAMCNAIAHRGPDSDGLWISDDGNVGFGHRRLSIVDLSPEADQPMGADGGMLIFNGEIYNHGPLRQRMEREGTRFRTDHSDSETLLHGCIQMGPRQLIEQLNGMFAFAFYNTRTHKLFLVRDRVGIKPLYYTRLQDGLAFCSEIKGLLALDEVEPQLNEESFGHYLSFRATPAPLTLFKGIEKLSPGSFLEMDTRSGEITVKTWWDPLDSPELSETGEAELADRLFDLLGESINLRTMADVPLGLFLSGGLDSAFLLDRVAATHSGASTFTVHYPGHDAYNEHHVARDLAQKAGARHHEVPIDRERYYDALASVSYFQDEPIAAPVCISVYYLSQAARNAGVPVIFTGEGADELFVGYPNWLKVRDLQRGVNVMPNWAARLMGSVLTPAVSAVVPPFARYPEFFRRMGAGQPLFWGGAMDFTERDKRVLLGPKVSQDDPNHSYQEIISPLWNHYRERRDARDITGWMSYLDLRFRLPELMLMRVDKMGMAFSIEGRVPFLDHRIVELATMLPAAWRVAQGKQTKAMLKKVIARTLPHEFVYQRKRGFAAPMREWKDRAMSDIYLPALLTFAQRTGLFRPEGIQQLWKQQGDRLYFNLVNFMMWYLIFIENVLPEHFPNPREQVLHPAQMVG